MAYKPFLSHKSEQAGQIAVLLDELRRRGAGGWRDADELRVGQRWMAAIKRAIGRETGGFIWWATSKSLGSRVITRVEVPAALRRARSHRRGQYPLVPVFVDVQPDSPELARALGRRTARRLNEYQGVSRKNRESIADLAARTARRYVHDIVVGHDGDLRIEITGGRAPTGEYDLTLDWRTLLDEDGRTADPAAVAAIVETLRDIREAAQSLTACPHLIVEAHLRLPLAALVGWEWNRVRPMRLTAIQRGVHGQLSVPDDATATAALPDPAERKFSGSGPAIVAVSVGKDLGGAVERYATSQDACETIHLHIPTRDHPGCVLDACEIGATSNWTVERLAALNARGAAKHLLLLGPVSLAMRIGAAANGTGRVRIPFWDGDKGYLGGIDIG